MTRLTTAHFRNAGEHRPTRIPAKPERPCLPVISSTGVKHISSNARVDV